MRPMPSGSSGGASERRRIYPKPYFLHPVHSYFPYPPPARRQFAAATLRDPASSTFPVRRTCDSEIRAPSCGHAALSSREVTSGQAGGYRYGPSVEGRPPIQRAASGFGLSRIRYSRPNADRKRIFGMAEAKVAQPGRLRGWQESGPCLRPMNCPYWRVGAFCFTNLSLPVRKAHAGNTRVVAALIPSVTKWAAVSGSSCQLRGLERIRGLEP